MNISKANNYKTELENDRKYQSPGINGQVSFSQRLVKIAAGAAVFSLLGAALFGKIGGFTDWFTSKDLSNRTVTPSVNGIRMDLPSVRLHNKMHDVSLNAESDDDFPDINSLSISESDEKISRAVRSAKSIGLNNSTPEATPLDLPVNGSHENPNSTEDIPFPFNPAAASRSFYEWVDVNDIIDADGAVTNVTTREEATNGTTNSPLPDEVPATVTKMYDPASRLPPFDPNNTNITVTREEYDQARQILGLCQLRLAEMPDYERPFFSILIPISLSNGNTTFERIHLTDVSSKTINTLAKPSSNLQRYGGLPPYKSPAHQHQLGETRHQPSILDKLHFFSEWNTNITTPQQPQPTKPTAELTTARDMRVSEFFEFLKSNNSDSKMQIDVFNDQKTVLPRQWVQIHLPKMPLLPCGWIDNTEQRLDKQFVQKFDHISEFTKKELLELNVVKCLANHYQFNIPDPVKIQTAINTINQVIADCYDYDPERGYQLTEPVLTYQELMTGDCQNRECSFFIDRLREQGVTAVVVPARSDSSADHHDVNLRWHPHYNRQNTVNEWPETTLELVPFFANGTQSAHEPAPGYRVKLSELTGQQLSKLNTDVLHLDNNLCNLLAPIPYKPPYATSIDETWQAAQEQGDGLTLRGLQDFYRYRPGPSYEQLTSPDFTVKCGEETVRAGAMLVTGHVDYWSKPTGALRLRTEIETMNPGRAKKNLCHPPVLNALTKLLFECQPAINKTQCTENIELLAIQQLQRDKGINRHAVVANITKPTEQPGQFSTTGTGDMIKLFPPEYTPGLQSLAYKPRTHDNYWFSLVDPQATTETEDNNG